MWRQGPFLRDASTRQMGRAVKSTPPTTPQPWRQYLRLLQRFHFCKRKGFEKFDGGNKGLAGGRLGKKRNLFLAGRRLTGLGVARILCKKESRKCDVNTSSPLFFRAKEAFFAPNSWNFLSSCSSCCSQLCPALVASGASGTLWFPPTASARVLVPFL